MSSLTTRIPNKPAHNSRLITQLNGFFFCHVVCIQSTQWTRRLACIHFCNITNHTQKHTKRATQIFRINNCDNMSSHTRRQLKRTPTSPRQTPQYFSISPVSLSLRVYACWYCGVLTTTEIKIQIIPIHKYTVKNKKKRWLPRSCVCQQRICTKTHTSVYNYWRFSWLVGKKSTFLCFCNLYVMFFMCSL